MSTILSYGPAWGVLFLLVCIVIAVIQTRSRSSKRASERLAEPRNSRARLGFTEDEIRARTDLYIAPTKSSPRGDSRRAA